MSVKILTLYYLLQRQTYYSTGEKPVSYFILNTNFLEKEGNSMSSEGK